MKTSKKNLIKTLTAHGGVIIVNGDRIEDSELKTILDQYTVLLVANRRIIAVFNGTQWVMRHRVNAVARRVAGHFLNGWQDTAAQSVLIIPKDDDIASVLADYRNAS